MALPRGKKRTLPTAASPGGSAAEGVVLRSLSLCKSLSLSTAHARAHTTTTPARAHSRTVPPWQQVGERLLEACDPGDVHVKIKFRAVGTTPATRRQALYLFIRHNSSVAQVPVPAVAPLPADPGAGSYIHDYVENYTSPGHINAFLQNCATLPWPPPARVRFRMKVKLGQSWQPYDVMY